MKYLRQLEDLRDEILANHEGHNATHVFREMCGSDLKLLKEWTWDRFVYLALCTMYSLCKRNRFIASCLVLSFIEMSVDDSKKKCNYTSFSLSSFHELFLFSVNMSKPILICIVLTL